MILRVSISILTIAGWSVWCMFLDCMVFGFSFREYGYVSLDEPEFLCFKVMGWWLKGVC